MSPGVPSQAPWSHGLSVSCKRNSASIRKYSGIDTANTNTESSPLQGPWNNRNTSVRLSEAKRIPESVREQSLLKRPLKFTVHFHSKWGLCTQKSTLSLWRFSVKPGRFITDTGLYKLSAPTALPSALVWTAWCPTAGKSHNQLSL